MILSSTNVYRYCLIKFSIGTLYYNNNIFCLSMLKNVIFQIRPILYTVSLFS